MPELSLQDAPLWLFYACMLLGLTLHVLVKIDAWWKPEFAHTGVTFLSYFTEYPVRSVISATATILVALLMWDSGIRHAAAAAAAGYMGNSLLDGFLGPRRPVS